MSTESYNLHIFLIGYFLFFLFHFVITILFFLQYKRKKNNASDLALHLQAEKNEKESIILKQKILEERLRFTKNEIDSYIKSIKEKVNLIDQLKENKENEKITSSIKDSVILTEEDWELFKKRFIQIHPDFVVVLNDSYPLITKGQKRLLYLVKLGLTNAEIASMQGVSSQSIRTTWYRLKENIEAPVSNMVEFVNTIV